MVDDFIVIERSVEFPSRRVFRYAGRDVSMSSVVLVLLLNI
jgi:hypothetical protein